MTLFIFSLALVLLCIFTMIAVKAYYGGKIIENLVGFMAAFVLCLTALFGLIMIPSLKPIKTENTEITKGIIFFKYPEAIIIDLSNSPDGKYFEQKFIKFNSYKSVTEFSDSTKFFRQTERSFYNLPTGNNVVWSNPPYKDFYKE